MFFCQADCRGALLVFISFLPQDPCKYICLVKTFRQKFFKENFIEKFGLRMSCSLEPDLPPLCPTNWDRLCLFWSRLGK